ncbi:MAG: type II secretion system secretin GspD [Pseudomonadota bacterium]
MTKTTQKRDFFSCDKLRPFASLIFLCCLSLAQATFAQKTISPGVEVADSESGGKSITLNLKNTDIQAFISAISEITGRNFVVDPRVKGQVTVISAAPTSPDAIYDVFLSVLKVHGFSAIDSGEVTKIVPEVGARTEGTGAVVTRAANLNENIVTAVVPIRFINPAELVPILRPLLPQEAHLAATASSNALVIADTATNVDRISRIIRQLDRDNTDEIEIITLQHASADTMVATLQSAAAKEGQPGPSKLILIADTRTNSILLGGPTATRIRLRELILQLDVPGTTEGELIEVIYLRYANAADILPVLQSIGQQAQQGGATRAQPRNRGQQQAAPAPVRRGTGVNNFQVQADEATNALIVQAEPSLMLKIKKVIAGLDIRRAQVLVEGIVAEVSTIKADELGVQWKTNLPDTGVVGGTLFQGNASGAIDSPFDLTDGPGFLPGLTLGYLTSGDLRTLIRALAGDQSTNVLSTPTLMTLDNAEAEIVVGQNVPFITGQFTNDATTPDNPFQTIERQDVGIVLKVKPQINEGDALTLEIEQEVSSVNSDTSGADLITNKRSIKTTVLVDDREVIVLGGLIEDDVRENEQKIPLIGDIPLIGNFFKNTRSDFTKTNLMVFLRPTIIRDQQTSKALTQQRYIDIREKQQLQEKDHFFLREEGPVLPALDGLIE